MLECIFWSALDLPSVLLPWVFPLDLLTSIAHQCRYPIAEVDYTIPSFPVNISLEAFNPMCPLDQKNSSLPVAIFTFNVTNPGTAPVTVRLLQSQQNLVGWNGSGDCTPPNKTPFWGGNVNTATKTGIMLANPSQPSGAKRENSSFGQSERASICLSGPDNWIG